MILKYKNNHLHYKGMNLGKLAEILTHFGLYKPL